MRLLENPVLIEHEAFAETLLAGDISRACQSLLNRWLYYMENLQEHYPYPYLFSLALRVNPFDPEASPVLRS